jgi:hypothetical protein
MINKIVVAVTEYAWKTSTKKGAIVKANANTRRIYNIIENIK